jgi:hypothetical protein
MSDPNGGAAKQASAALFLETHVGKIMGGLALGVLLLGTVAYRFLEDWSWVDSFYFSAVAVATVGFGDLTPTSDASKLFTVFYIFSGITIITVWLNSRFKYRAKKRAGPQVSPDVGAPDTPDAEA